LISYHPNHPFHKDGGQLTIPIDSGNYNCRQAGGLIVAHHEWQAKVSYRVHGNKCPECPKPIRPDANSFVFISDSAPELTKEWHPTLNLPLLPEAVKPGSTKVKIWWICSKNPEHVWQSTPSNRTKGRGCPHCARGASLAVKYPEIAKEWHPSKNGDLKPSDLSYWMAIQFDVNHYSVYFGSLESLGGSTGIPISKCQSGEVGTTLVNRKRHYFDFEFYKNTRSRSCEKKNMAA
jgi:hypothetical protein